MAIGSNSPGYRMKVGWEDQVEAQLAQGVRRFRELLGDSDPEVRSMAALALSCSSTDAGGDFEVLRDRFVSESMELARACMGEALATVGLRNADDASIESRLEQFLTDTMRTETDLVRYRTALAFSETLHNAWSDRAAGWLANANVSDHPTMWPCEA